ncbi:uncharacterized protein LOC143298492 [Babylonia areolata]|uniref:uncharacterized protein LOC143298492 n=1 Tax=Babylonia areolata TaxID=304850 RepID=UPI003FD34FFD
MLVLGLLCCAAFSVLVGGQSPSHAVSRQTVRPRSVTNNLQRIQSRQRSGRPRLTGAAGGPNHLPQSWQELIIRRGGIHNVNDFIDLLVTDDGRNVTEDDIFSPFQTEDGKRVINGGGIMATSDECSPRNMSVRLPLDYSDNQVAYYPECTMVQRCGGCTPTQFLSCEPRYKEKIVLKVLRARYLYPGALSMRWEGFSSVEVERHLSCRAVCNLDPSDCLRNQRFDPYQCKCLCVRFQSCRNAKVWDPEQCYCRCPNEGPCCAESGEEDDRTCTSYFDRDFCECTLKTSIGFSPNATMAEIEAWMQVRNRGNLSPTNRPRHSPTPTATTATTTTTTTTAATGSQSNCRDRICPRNFVGTANSRGLCVCTFRRRRPSRRG